MSRVRRYARRTTEPTTRVDSFEFEFGRMLDIRRRSPSRQRPSWRRLKKCPRSNELDTKKAPIPYFRRQAFAREIVLEAAHISDAHHSPRPRLFQMVPDVIRKGDLAEPAEVVRVVC